MFYIHGGGFFEGSGNDDILGPDFIINEDVILVNQLNESIYFIHYIHFLKIFFFPRLLLTID